MAKEESVKDLAQGLETIRCKPSVEPNGFSEVDSSEIDDPNKKDTVDRPDKNDDEFEGDESDEDWDDDEEDDEDDETCDDCGKHVYKCDCDD